MPGTTQPKSPIRMKRIEIVQIRLSGMRGVGGLDRTRIVVILDDVTAFLTFMVNLVLFEIGLEDIIGGHSDGLC